MVKNFIIVKVDSNYCNYLRSFDSKVMYNDGAKDLRPFIGVLFSVNGFEFFVPLASPKAKHSTIQNKIDVVKIDDGKLGVLNFNNMIPVTKDNYELIDLTYKYL